MNNNLLYILGIGMAFLGIYRIVRYGYIVKRIKKTHFFFGVLAAILMLEVIDLLSTKWLYNSLGKVTYYRIIGIAWDVLILGTFFGCDYRVPVSENEKRLDKIRIAVSVLGLSWYFMYYLCK